MMNLQSYRVSITASIVAIVVSPLTLIGLPIGIWALAVLTKKEVQAAFPHREKQRPDTATRLDSELIQLRVKRPAIGLIVLGGINILFILLYVLGTLEHWESEGWEAAWSSTLEMGPIVLTGMALSVPFSIVMISGGVRMIRLESYGFAITAGILALIPFSFTFVIGLPIGIWALAVLTRKDVKDAFAREKSDGNPLT